VSCGVHQGSCLQLLLDLVNFSLHPSMKIRCAIGALSKKNLSKIQSTLGENSQPCRGASEVLCSTYTWALRSRGGKSKLILHLHKFFFPKKSGGVFSRRNIITSIISQEKLQHHLRYTCGQIILRPIHKRCRGFSSF
jgi:hypothetical protein